MDQFKTEVDDLLHENRIFQVPSLFHDFANIKDDSLYAQARADRLAFWEQCAKKLEWSKPWKQALVWKRPFAKWFVGGKINASYNCLDRHIKANLGNKTALIWEGEDGAQKTFSYAESYLEVNKLANAIKSFGIK